MATSGPRRWALLLASTWLLATTAQAQGGAGAGASEDTRWAIFIGGFFPEVDSDLRLNAPEFGLSPSIDFEDLGLESDASVLRLGAMCRLSRNGRHVLELEYLAIDRDGRFVLDEELELGGAVYPVGVDVDAQIETEDLDLHYMYNLLKSERGWLGLAVGIHALQVEVSAEGTVEIGGQVQANHLERYTDEFPLPLVGLRGGYELAKSLWATAGFKWLGVAFDEFDGSFTDSWVRLEYRLARPISIGVGWARIDVDYERELEETERAIIEATYDYTGGEAFLRLLF
jgi:hypothetical protein